MSAATIRPSATAVCTFAVKASAVRRGCCPNRRRRLIAASSSSSSWSSPSSPRFYATQHQQTSSSSSSSASASASASRRRSVTPFNDDGHVPWTDLSAAEKTARAAQQTFNFGLVVAGVVLTGAVGYFLYTDVFSPNSRAVAFNRAVDRIRADPACVAALVGDVPDPLASDSVGSRAISAFGEATNNKWQRARPIASTERTDAQGDHLLLNFHVQGIRAQGTAYVHMLRRPGESMYTYRSFYVDVPGHERIYLERPQDSSSGGHDKRTLFGIKWA